MKMGDVAGCPLSQDVPSTRDVDAAYRGIVTGKGIIDTRINPETAPYIPYHYGLNTGMKRRSRKEAQPTKRCPGCGGRIVTDECILCAALKG